MRYERVNPVVIVAWEGDPFERTFERTFERMTFVNNVGGGANLGLLRSTM